MASDPNPSKPADPAVDSWRDYARELSRDPEVHALVRKKAGRVARVFGLDHHEREELGQDLLLELLKALDRFDPARGKLIAFAHGTANRWYLTEFRRLKRAGRRPREGHLGEKDLLVESQEPPPGDVAGVREDAAELMAALPPELAEIARAVTRDTVAKVAERAGVHRATVKRRLERARAIAEEAGQGKGERKSSGARNKGLGAAERPG